MLMMQETFHMENILSSATFCAGNHRGSIKNLKTITFSPLDLKQGSMPCCDESVPYFKNQ